MVKTNRQHIHNHQNSCLTLLYFVVELRGRYKIQEEVTHAYKRIKIEVTMAWTLLPLGHHCICAGVAG